MLLVKEFVLSLKGKKNNIGVPTFKLPASTNITNYYVRRFCYMITWLLDHYNFKVLLL